MSSPSRAVILVFRISVRTPLVFAVAGPNPLRNAPKIVRAKFRVRCLDAAHRDACSRPEVNLRRSILAGDLRLHRSRMDTEPLGEMEVQPDRIQESVRRAGRHKCLRADQSLAPGSVTAPFARSSLRFIRTVSGADPRSVIANTHAVPTRSHAAGTPLAANTATLRGQSSTRSRMVLARKLPS